MTIVRSLVESMTGHQGPTPAEMRSSSAVRLGSIPLIGSRGIQRSATYRMIYLTNPWVYGAVNKLAGDLARLHIHTFEVIDEIHRNRVRADVSRKHPGQSLDSLLMQPDPDMSRFAFWHGTMIDKLINGNAMATKQREGGLITGLRRDRWRDVTHIQQKRGRAVFYEISEEPMISSARKRFVPEDVIHFGRGLDSDEVVSPSPLESGRYTLALYDGVIRHLTAFFENQARPSGHISVENLNREKARLIREMITEAYASPENAGKVLVTAGKWEAAGSTPDHSQVSELIKFSREEIATIYRMPPPMIGILDRATYANVKALREQYIREGLALWVNDIQDDLMAQLVNHEAPWKGRGLFVEFQLAEQLRPDPEARALVYQRLRSFLSIDEIRQLENLPPFELKGISDVPWADPGAQPISGYVPPNKAGKQGAKSPFEANGISDEATRRMAEEVARILLERNGHKTVDPAEVGK